MPRCYWMDLVVYLLGFFLFVSHSDCKTSFISSPANTVYVSVGETVTLTWKYTVDDRIAEFKDHSPTWHLLLPNGTDIQLAYENKLSRIWNLSTTCPSRLRTRLYIQNSSSLVIKNVTTGDSGTYGCTLNLTNGASLTSRVELIVTETPKFTTSLPQTVMRREGQDLSIDCIARGSPTPVVKWVRIFGGNKVLKTQGKGRAGLVLRNIRREQNGTYECQASNNPDIIVNNRIDVLVEYRPSIDSLSSSPITVASWDNHTISLRCMASGNPPPDITWIYPNKIPIKYGVSPLNGGSLLTIQTRYKIDYGQYRCRASNSQGYVYRYIDVKRIVVPHPPILLEVTSTVSIIEVRWRRPTLDGGGPVIDYRITIDTKPPRAVSVEGTSVIIAGLVKDTNYQIKMFARNVVGLSNATRTYISTKAEENVAKEEISGSVVLGVCLPIIFILLVVIVIMLVYNWWKWRKRKQEYAQPESVSTNTESDPPAREIDSIELKEEQKKQNGTAPSSPPKETPRKEYNGSCLPFYMKRQKRRPGKSKQPRPLVILESITEENAEEESTDDSPIKKQYRNDKMPEEEENAFCEEPSDEESIEEDNTETA